MIISFHIPSNPLFIIHVLFDAIIWATYSIIK
jgi:hypothetical protein